MNAARLQPRNARCTTGNRIAVPQLLQPQQRCACFPPAEVFAALQRLASLLVEARVALDLLVGHEVQTVTTEVPEQIAGQQLDHLRRRGPVAEDPG